MKALKIIAFLGLAVSSLMAIGVLWLYLISGPYEVVPTPSKWVWIPFVSIVIVWSMWVSDIVFELRR